MGEWMVALAESFWRVQQRRGEELERGLEAQVGPEAGVFS